MSRGADTDPGATNQADADPADRLVQATARLFDLLGDPTRVRLLYALLDEGELHVGALAERADVSESAVSHALRLLRTATVVTSRRDGRSVHYRLDDEHVRDLLVVAREHLEEDLATARDRSGRRDEDTSRT